MLYELRIYECCPGRLPALLDRFNTITLKIWERHGIRQAGFWTTVIGESNHQLVYMLEWESPVSYTHLTLPTMSTTCRSRWWGGQ